MKTIKFLKLAVLAIVTITVASCVDSDEYNVPPTAEQVEPNVTVNSSVEAVKEAWNQNFFNEDEAIYTFEQGNSLYLEGYVVSSDYAGNFYKTLIIQDAPENPTHGIEVLVDKTSLFESYEVGRKVYIKLDGLSVSYDDGVSFNSGPTNGTPGRYSLGYLNGNQVDDIPLFLYPNHILRSTTVMTIVPKVITTADFTQDNINTFVQIQDMQFSVGELGKTYSGETNDQFDGFRNLFSCADESGAILQTSTFADFKSFVVPSEVGSINAVLAKDFRADFFVLIISDPTNINFTTTERCDPLFNDDFSSGNLDQWTPYSVIGVQEWYYNSFGNPDDSATMSGYSSGNQNNEDWLISKAIDLSAESGATTFSFDNVKRYNGPDIEVFMATDYAGGDPTTDGTWVSLPAMLDSNTGSWSSWVNSGALDVSAANGGNLFVAIKYTSTTGGSATIEIDNVKVE